MWKFQLTLCLYVLILAVAVKSAGTPANIDEIFLGRCHEYQQVMRPDLFVNGSKDCNDLLRLFNEAYRYKDPCNVTVESFEPFVLAAKHDIYTQDRTLYWSGDVTPLVFEYSAEGRRLTTIRDTLAGYILKNLEKWCGQLEDPGINIVSCPGLTECLLQAQSSCWKSLSRSFALQVEGSVRVMLNGSNGRAYIANSYFGLYELPYLDSTRNPIVYVQLVHNIDEPDFIRETCQNGTLLNLKADVEQKNIVFNCTDDPLDVFYLQCVDHLDNSKCRNL